MCCFRNRKAIAVIVMLTSLAPTTVYAADRFGLVHACLGQEECKDDRIICTDEGSTGDVCQITCGSDGQYSSCKAVTFVIANSGGLQLDCVTLGACAGVAEIIWVNSDNLATYQALNADATIGSALHSLTCSGAWSCQALRVRGWMQEADTVVETQWICSGKAGCIGTAAWFHSVALQCTFDHSTDGSCNNMALTCLSQGNCETTAVSADAANGASMTCESGVHICDCGQYFTCVLLTTTKEATSTALSTSTTEELSTTKTDTTTTTKPTTTSKPTTTATPTEAMSSTLAAASTTPVMDSTRTEWMPTTSAKPTSQNTTESKASTTSASTALPTTTLEDSKDSNKSTNWAMIFFVFGVTVGIFAVLIGGFYLYTELSDKREEVDANCVQLQHVTSAADQCEDVVVLEPVISVPTTIVSQAAAGRCEANGEHVTVGRDDSVERGEVKDALHKVDKMKRDAKDDDFGHMLADLNLGNALLEEDVVEGMGVVGETLGYESPVAAEEKAQEYVTAGGDHLDLDESSSFDY